MLSVRYALRLCKQSTQYTVGRPSIFFSSNADDSKSPPFKDESPNQEDEKRKSLDSLLDATYSRKVLNIKHVSGKARSSPARSVPKEASKSDSASRNKDVLPPKTPVRKIEGDIPLERLLQAAHTRTGVTADDVQSEEKPAPKSGTAVPQSLDLSIKKKKQTVTSDELLNKLRRIAQEVAGAAGPKSNEVAEGLLKKLQSIPKASEKPIDLNELTFEDHSKGGTNQSLDLLRNKIVSEEQIYKIVPSPEDTQWQRRSSPSQVDSRDQSRSRRINVYRDLDVSLHPKMKIGIFEVESIENKTTKSCLKTFDRLEARELNLSNSYAPRNWFEQCIQWTEQGKLWHFPINNEQGQEEAAAVSFTEHVFLEDHLEGWCPTFGPVRHFMELVCLGLSRNPYLSVEEKIDYIVWYRNYLEKHRDILEAAGTMSPGVTKVPALEAQ